MILPYLLVAHGDIDRQLESGTSLSKTKYGFSQIYPMNRQDAWLSIVELLLELVVSYSLSMKGEKPF